MVELVEREDTQVTPVLTLVIVLFYLVVNMKMQAHLVEELEVLTVQQSEKSVV